MCITNNPPHIFESFGPTVNFPLPHTFIAILECHQAANVNICYRFQSANITFERNLSFLSSALSSSSPSKV
jgi:hypothetical protein